MAPTFVGGGGGRDRLSIVVMTDLELRHLRAVCAIADAGSITKAASTLGVTQPGLSAQLRAVEEIIGGSLFNRDSAGCTPTEIGTDLIAMARPLLNDLVEMTDHARQLAGASTT